MQIEPFLIFARGSESPKEAINGKRPFGSHLVQQSLEANLGDDQD
jgi:hypothetical protein